MSAKVCSINRVFVRCKMRPSLNQCLLISSLFILVLPSEIYSAHLGPSRTIPSHWFDNYPRSLQLDPSPQDIERRDKDFAVHGHKHGRVQIKVFRGPTQEGHHELYAPHGYWVKQPAADDDSR